MSLCDDSSNVCRTRLTQQDDHMSQLQSMKQLTHEHKRKKQFKQTPKGHKQHRVQLGAIKELLETQTCAPKLIDFIISLFNGSLVTSGGGQIRAPFLQSSPSAAGGKTSGGV